MAATLHRAPRSTAVLSLKKAVQDAGVLLWAAEPSSSKDTVSRMNSPRNSKSSGTAVRSCDKGNSTDRDLDAVSSRSADHEEQHMHGRSERSASPGSARDALEDISNVVSSSQQDLLPGSSQEGHSPGVPAAKRASRSPSAYMHGGAFSHSGATAERDAAAAEIESRVVSPPEESPDGAACLEALQEADGYEGYSNLELGSSDSFLLSPSKAKLRIKARGLKRPRTLALEMTDDPPRTERLEALLHGDESQHLARLTDTMETCELATPAQCEPPLLHCGDILEENSMKAAAVVRALLEAVSFSRAASAAPGTEVTEVEGGSNDGVEEEVEEGQEEEEEVVVPRRPRGGKAKRKPPLSTRRSGRVAGLDDHALGAASDDEDYCPPGEADEAAAPKRQRLRVRASAPLLSTPEACASGPTRGSCRFRWSNTTGSMGSPVALASPSGGSRRLRSQPVDLNTLRPDAFAFSPASKRARTTQLQAAVANLEHLRSLEGTTLARSSVSGINKPYPLWLGPLDSELRACGKAACQDAIQVHASDLRLLDQGRPPAPSRVEAGRRLESSPLGKAMRRAGNSQAAEVCSDQLLPACRSLFPEFLEPALAYWEERLLTPCHGAYGETTTCSRARQERDLQNTWEDLLARHASEAGALEGFRQWLLPVEEEASE